MDASTSLTVALTIITGIIVPAVGRLFAKFSKVDDRIERAETALEAERDARRQLELKMAVEYVNKAALKEVMEPYFSKLTHLDRMMERIASRLQIPAVGEN